MPLRSSSQTQFSTSFLGFVVNSTEEDRSVRNPLPDDDVSFDTTSDGKYVATSSSPSPCISNVTDVVPHVVSLRTHKSLLSVSSSSFLRRLLSLSPPLALGQFDATETEFICRLMFRKWAEHFVPIRILESRSITTLFTLPATSPGSPQS